MTTDAIPGREFDGTLTAVNSAIDPATRNVSLQATLKNRPRLARWHVRAGQRHPAEKNPTLYIPATSVSYAPYGDSVFVIEKKHDEKTKQDNADLAPAIHSTGRNAGRFRRRHKGLKAGQQVVSTGAFKLRNGMNVVIDNKLAPKAELNPTPNDT